MLRFIWTFNEFDDIYLLTGGGGGTEVVSVRVYDLLTGRGDIGAAAAQSLVLAGAARGAAVRSTSGSSAGRGGGRDAT